VKIVSYSLAALSRVILFGAWGSIKMWPERSSVPRFPISFWSIQGIQLYAYEN
jgi:hypothetical protein